MGTVAIAALAGAAGYLIGVVVGCARGFPRAYAAGYARGRCDALRESISRMRAVVGRN